MRGFRAPSSGAQQDLSHQIWNGPEVATSSESGSSQHRSGSHGGSSLGLDAGQLPRHNRMASGSQLLHVVYRDDGSDSQGPESSAYSNGRASGPLHSHKQEQVIVKNSFIEVVDAESISLARGAQVRSRSASEMSSRTSNTSRSSPRESGPKKPGITTIDLGNLRAPLPVVPLAPPAVAPQPRELPRPAAPQAVAAAALAPAAPPVAAPCFAAASASQVDRDVAAEDDEPQGKWSEGSRHHDKGECRPCLYVNTKAGCLNGARCQFCHYNHGPRSRTRLCKAKRQQCKQMATNLYGAYDGDVSRLLLENPGIANEGPEQNAENCYMLSIIKSRQRHEKSEQGPQLQGPSGPHGQLQGPSGPHGQLQGPSGQHGGHVSALRGTPNAQMSGQIPPGLLGAMQPAVAVRGRQQPLPQPIGPMGAARGGAARGHHNFEHPAPPWAL